MSKTHDLLNLLDLKSSKFGEHSVIERLESVLDASTGKQCAISKNIKMSKKFNFLENIFELSETQNKEELPNEWEFIIRHQCVDKSKTCVCNCKIKIILSLSTD